MASVRMAILAHPAHVPTSPKMYPLRYYMVQFYGFREVLSGFEFQVICRASNIHGNDFESWDVVRGRVAPINGKFENKGTIR